MPTAKKPLLAYCPEVDKNISIHEAWDLMYGENPVKKDLTFKCATEGCGIRLTTHNLRPWSCHGASFRIYANEPHNHRK